MDWIIYRIDIIDKSIYQLITLDLIFVLTLWLAYVVDDFSIKKFKLPLGFNFWKCLFVSGSLSLTFLSVISMATYYFSFIDITWGFVIIILLYAFIRWSPPTALILRYLNSKSGKLTDIYHLKNWQRWTIKKILLKQYFAHVFQLIKRDPEETANEIKRVLENDLYRDLEYQSIKTRELMTAKHLFDGEPIYIKPVYSHCTFSYLVALEAYNYNRKKDSFKINHDKVVEYLKKKRTNYRISIIGFSFIFIFTSLSFIKYDYFASRFFMQLSIVPLLDFLMNLNDTTKYTKHVERLIYNVRYAKDEITLKNQITKLYDHTKADNIHVIAFKGKEGNFIWSEAHTRHHGLYHWDDTRGKLSRPITQGFVSMDGKFLDREHAWKLLSKSPYHFNEEYNHQNKLYSEHIC